MARSRAPGHLGLQPLFRPFVRVHDAGCAPHAVTGHNDSYGIAGNRPSSVVAPRLSCTGVQLRSPRLALASCPSVRPSPNSTIAEPNAIERERPAVYGKPSGLVCRAHGR